MEHEGSLPHSQVLATCPYPDHILILPSGTGSSPRSKLHPTWFSTFFFLNPLLVFQKPATFSTHLTNRYFVYRITHGNNLLLLTYAVSFPLPRILSPLFSSRYAQHTLYFLESQTPDLAFIQNYE